MKKIDKHTIFYYILIIKNNFNWNKKKFSKTNLIYITANIISKIKNILIKHKLVEFRLKKLNIVIIWELLLIKEKNDGIKKLSANERDEMTCYFYF